jgi:hypothetical protein
MTGVVTRADKGAPLSATDHDDNLEVMISLHKSATEPSPTYACMLWADTSTTLLKMRNSADSAWITLGTLDTSGAFGGGISSLVEDATPQLGGTLDANGNIIDMGVNTVTDTKVGEWDTAYGWGNHASIGYLDAADIGVSVQAYDADTAKTDTTQNFTAPQRSADTVDNDGSFDLSAAQNFTCTPTGNFTLTFTNIPDGQSGVILLVNSGGYTVSAAATTKVMGADFLTTVSTAGTYVIGYYSDGTDVRVYNSGAQQ